MDVSDSHVLQYLHSTLRDSLAVSGDLLAELYAKGIITKEERTSVITAENGVERGIVQKAECLLDILPNCGRDAFGVFHKALGDSPVRRNQDLAEKLTKAKADAEQKRPVPNIPRRPKKPVQERQLSSAVPTPGAYEPVALDRAEQAATQDKRSDGPPDFYPRHSWPSGGTPTPVLPTSNTHPRLNDPSLSADWAEMKMLMARLSSQQRKHLLTVGRQRVPRESFRPTMVQVPNADTAAVTQQHGRPGSVANVSRDSPRLPPPPVPPKPITHKLPQLPHTASQRCASSPPARSLPQTSTLNTFYADLSEVDSLQLEEEQREIEDVVSLLESSDSFSSADSEDPTSDDSGTELTLAHPKSSGSQSLASVLKTASCLLLVDEEFFVESNNDAQKVLMSYLREHGIADENTRMKILPSTTNSMAVLALSNQPYPRSQEGPGVLVRVVIRAKWNDHYRHLAQQAIVGSLSEYLGDNRVTLRAVYEGSTTMLLEIPALAVRELYRLAAGQAPLLAGAGIVDVSAVGRTTALHVQPRHGSHPRLRNEPSDSERQQMQALAESLADTISAEDRRVVTSQTSYALSLMLSAQYALHNPSQLKKLKAIADGSAQTRLAPVSGTPALSEDDGKLMAAAQQRQLDLLKEAVAKCTDINVMDKAGRTALFLAASVNFVDGVKVLWSTSADINLPRRGGTSPLHIASINGCYETVKFLSNLYGIKVDVQDKYGRTPIHWAARRGYIRIVEELSNAGANIHARDKCGKETPLHLAADRGHVAVAQYLQELGASDLVVNEFGKTPRDYAERQGNAL